MWRHIVLTAIRKCRQPEGNSFWHSLPLFVPMWWQLRECEMGATVNRDLQQRIRPINGLTLHQQITKSDIKNVAKIVQNFDNRWNMWDSEADGNDNCSQPTTTVNWDSLHLQFETLIIIILNSFDRIHENKCLAITINVNTCNYLAICAEHFTLLFQYLRQVGCSRRLK